MRSSMMTDDVRPFGDSVRERIEFNWVIRTPIADWVLYGRDAGLPFPTLPALKTFEIRADHYFDGTTHRFRFTDLIDYEQSHHFPGNKLICLTDEYWCQPNIDRHSVLKNLYDKTVTQCEEYHAAGKS